MRHAIFILAVLIGACVENSRRPEIVGRDVALDQTQALAVLRAAITADIEKMLEANVEATVTGVREEIKPISDVSQKAGLAVSRIDQSNSDKWVNRGLMVGVVLALLGSYPIGRWVRLVWSRSKTKT